MDIRTESLTGRRMERKFCLHLSGKVAKRDSTNSILFLLKEGPPQNYRWLMLNSVPIHQTGTRWPLLSVARPGVTGNDTVADGRQIFIFLISIPSVLKIFQQMKQPEMNSP